MKRLVQLLALSCLALSFGAHAQSMNWDSTEIDWTDYSLGFLSEKDKVPEAEPVFGKEFQGFSLKLHTAEAEFEQEMPVAVIISLKNTNPRSTLQPDAAPSGGRSYAVHIILADKMGENSLFSKNLLTADDNALRTGKIPPRAETVVLKVPFDTLEVAKVDEFLDGKPHFDPKTRLTQAGMMIPQIYKLRAILLSAEAEKRPDFLIASQSWDILLRPKSVARMTEAEKQEKLQRYIPRMEQGGSGAMAVADQLAALGEVAVAPLMEVASRRGGKNAQTTMESRVWALATLCNTNSPEAQAFIEQKLLDPTALGDLNFLAWHSQRLRSPKITAAIRKLAFAIATGEKLSWEKNARETPDGVKISFLGWAFRHFSRIKETVPDEIAEGCFRLEDPRLSSLAFDVWEPSSPQKVMDAAKPLYLTAGTHPNLKCAALRALAKHYGAQGFPPYDRKADVIAAWRHSGVRLAQKGYLTKGELATLLRNQIIFARSPDAQRELVADFVRHAGPDFPVRTAQVTLPDDWTKTWQWCLRTGDFTTEQATQFLCVQMMTREELPDSVKRALLIELKRQLGDEFPLPSTEKVNLDDDWPTCGNWLIEKGHFKPGKGRR